MKTTTILIVCALLTACATSTVKKPPVNAPSDDASIKIAEAATSVSHSLLEMAQVEKTITPPKQDNTLTIPNTYNMQDRATVDWSGPIQEITARIAAAAHYKMRVIGKEPPLPVLVNVHVRDESLGTILRNMDYQAGQKASIHVYPNSQVVELRYAKFYS